MSCRVDVCVLFPRLLPQIPIATSGIRAMGYMMRHHLRTEGAAVSQRTITQFVKVQQEPDGHTLFTSPFKRRKWLLGGQRPARQLIGSVASSEELVTSHRPPAAGCCVYC